MTAGLLPVHEVASATERDCSKKGGPRAAITHGMAANSTSQGAPDRPKGAGTGRVVLDSFARRVGHARVSGGALPVGFVGD